MSALADNKFDRILDNDLSESVSMLPFSLFSTFRPARSPKQPQWSNNEPNSSRKTFMKNISSSIKLPEIFLRFSRRDRKEFMLIKNVGETRENLFFSVCFS